MMRLREHVNGLNGHNSIGCIESLKVTGLRGRIATHIDYAARVSEKDGVNHVIVHTGTRGVGDDYIRTAVPDNELLILSLMIITKQ